jgi:hypothetical protein
MDVLGVMPGIILTLCLIGHVAPSFVAVMGAAEGPPSVSVVERRGAWR